MRRAYSQQKLVVFMYISNSDVAFTGSFPALNIFLCLFFLFFSCYCFYFSFIFNWFWLLLFYFYYFPLFWGYICFNYWNLFLIFPSFEVIFFWVNSSVGQVSLSLLILELFWALGQLSPICKLLELVPVPWSPFIYFSVV